MLPALEVNPQISTKCDFCDIQLKTDLDISRHLLSDSHRSKLAHFLSLQNLNTKSVQKDVPKNLVQVLVALKLRSDRDAKELADKTFFKIYDDTIAEIAMELNKSLFKSLVEFETRTLPPGVRAAFINALKHEEPSADSKPNESAPKKPAKLTQTTKPNQSTKSTQPTKPTQPTKLAESQNSPTKPSSTIPSNTEKRIEKNTNGSIDNRVENRLEKNVEKRSEKTLEKRIEKKIEKKSVPKNNVNSSNVTGQPVPRQNSTYIPKLAVIPKIKTEPKDD